MNSKYIHINSFQMRALESEVVTIEALASRGTSNLRLTGLPDIWLKESKDKIQAIVAKLTGWDALDRVLIHILPEEETKNGAHLELPIALACLCVLYKESLPQKSRESLNSHSFVGSLGLDGSIRPTQTTVDIENSSHEKLIGPSSYTSIVELWSDLVFGNELKKPRPQLPKHRFQEGHSEKLKQHTVRGRFAERQWFVLAAAAKLPILLSGVPGVGKSYLARWAYGLVPLFQTPQKVESFGLDHLRRLHAAPLIAPHPRTPLHEFMGTQKLGYPQAGLFAMAHRGLLILDEFPEMNRDSREILRTVLDQKQTCTTTRGRRYTWPADFWLVATMNPCPCGYSRPDNVSECRCPNSLLFSYSRKVSGPLFERFGVKLFLDRNREHPEIHSAIPIEASHVQDATENMLPFNENFDATLRDEIQTLHADLSEREISNKSRLWQAFVQLTHRPFEEFREPLLRLIQNEKKLLGYRPNYPL